MCMFGLKWITFCTQTVGCWLFRVPVPNGMSLKVLDYSPQISRPWKITLVLESPWNYIRSSWNVLEYWYVVMHAVETFGVVSYLRYKKLYVFILIRFPYHYSALPCSVCSGHCLEWNKFFSYWVLIVAVFLSFKHFLVSPCKIVWGSFKVVEFLEN